MKLVLEGETLTDLIHAAAKVGGMEKSSHNDVVQYFDSIDGVGLYTAKKIAAHLFGKDCPFIVIKKGE
jgi:hypothetical protein